MHGSQGDPLEKGSKLETLVTEIRKRKGLKAEMPGSSTFGCSKALLWLICMQF
jgi:hypothetical protein